MLVLGISIGVSLNVVLPEWVITILVIVVLLGTAIKSIFKGLETWKKETKTKKCVTNVEDRINTPSGETNNPTETNRAKRREVSVLENVCWKQLGIIAIEWLIILGLQIGKNYVTKCSVAYWSLDLLQIPVVVGASSYQAVKLYQGKRVLSTSQEAEGANWRVDKLVFYCASGIAAGLVAGTAWSWWRFYNGSTLFGDGDHSSCVKCHSHLYHGILIIHVCGRILPPKRFPIPYDLYFAGVATIIRDHWATYRRKRGVGLANMVKNIEHKEYLGFENMCTHKS
ncbi:hypothetical protein M0R45_027636 [Rubus argutus]|uniref:Uncharacterized protein n=1 Tax=Rubus argutus TaxID=59490 RepID=A0AAW1X4E6_RUBAR